MSDYLSHLVERIALPQVALRPRTLSLFEPPHQPGGLVPEPPAWPPSRPVDEGLEPAPASAVPSPPPAVSSPTGRSQPPATFSTAPVAPHPAPPLPTPDQPLLVAPVVRPDRLRNAIDPTGEGVRRNRAEPALPARPAAESVERVDVRITRPAAAPAVAWPARPAEHASRPPADETDRAPSALAPSGDHALPPPAATPAAPPALLPVTPLPVTLLPRLPSVESLRHAEATPPPAIHVTIGRLEIRAQAPAAGSPRARSVKAAGADLEAYLRRKSGGGAA